MDITNTDWKDGFKMKKADMQQARFALDGLVIYRQLLQDQILADLSMLLEYMCTDYSDVFPAINLYSSVCHKLFQSGTGLKSAVIERILHAENVFSRAAETYGAECLKGSMEAAVKSDLVLLQSIANLEADTIKSWIVDCYSVDGERTEAVSNLPVFPENRIMDTDLADPYHTEMYELLMRSSCWADCAEKLAEYHHRFGSGVFSQHRAFIWKRRKTGDFSEEGYFEGVKSPDPITFSQLISYETERESVIENTLHFLDGYPANNILLYGDRGTGKSSTVKALINEYYNRGLRMIEVPKRYLADFPEIVGQLAGRNLKFILFIDDLAFEDNEENYTALKAALEGGLESRPKNVLIYATSNRKHLIKERFSDRAGLVSANEDDEVRASDTIQEKLSLSDRFGMTVMFSSPDQKRYLEIVEGIIKGRGLQVDMEFLRREAIRWELRYNGRSPRTAKQFADWLEGQLAAQHHSPGLS